MFECVPFKNQNLLKKKRTFMHEMRIIGLFWLLYLFHKFIPFLYRKKCSKALNFVVGESGIPI
jgi:hypothetical protein